MKKLGYTAGDSVVIPPYGVGVVSGISTRQIANSSFSYYQVEFPNTTSKAFVPIDAPSTTGMRHALTALEMPEICARLTKGQVNLPRQWSARHRRVTEILSSGEPFEIASLTAELHRWHLERGLPDLDRQAYRRALKMLMQEVRLIADESALEVQAFLDRAWLEVSN